MFIVMNFYLLAKYCPNAVEIFLKDVASIQRVTVAMNLVSTLADTLKGFECFRVLYFSWDFGLFLTDRAGLKVCSLSICSFFLNLKTD